MTDLLIANAAQLLTCSADAPDLVGMTPGGSVAVTEGRIEAVGVIDGGSARQVLDATGMVVLPGFVDSHTHVVFGGSRVDDYLARATGRPLPGGAPAGILGTVAQTRQLDAEALFTQSRRRVEQMLAHGTTTVESKSGYGLQPETELRLLQVGRRLAAALPVDVVNTFLGAHALPPEVDRDEYVDQVARLAAEAGRRGLAEFCDVYCDDGYFTAAEAKLILDAGLAAGLAAKLHLDAYSHTGAAGLAASIPATSVDHLNHTTPAELKVLAEAGVVGVYMPVLDFAAANPHPTSPGAIIGAGMELALATDACPSAHVLSMQLVIAFACRLGGLDVARAVRAATLGGARAIGMADRTGSLEPGKQADIVLLDLPRYEELGYRIGGNAVHTVIKRGEIVAGRPT